jgi:nicotinamidase/pyrazinamidase
MNALSLTILIFVGMLFAVLVTIAAGLAYIALPTRGTPIDRCENPKKAVLVIDVQEDFTTMMSRRAFRPEVVRQMITTINRVTEQARSYGMPVVYIRQEFDNWLTILLSRIGMGGLGIKGRAGTRLDPRVLIVADAADFTKRKGDAFSNPELDAYLRDRHVDGLYLMGLDGVACVNRTAQGALNRSYRVNFIMDGIITQHEDRWQKLVSRRLKEGVGATTADRFPD